jgi:hypothetical protein
MNFFCTFCIIFSPICRIYEYGSSASSPIALHYREQYLFLCSYSKCRPFYQGIRYGIPNQILVGACFIPSGLGSMRTWTIRSYQIWSFLTLSLSRSNHRRRHFWSYCCKVAKQAEGHLVSWGPFACLLATISSHSASACYCFRFYQYIRRWVTGVTVEFIMSFHKWYRGGHFHYLSLERD